MGTLDAGGQWCPNCGAEYRPGFTECSDCHVPLTAAPPPQEPSASDHDELVYDLSTWPDEQRREAELLLGSRGVPHGWDGDRLVVPHARETDVDALIDAIEEGTPLDEPPPVAVTG